MKGIKIFKYLIRIFWRAATCGRLHCWWKTLIIVCICLLQWGLSAVLECCNVCV